MPDESRSANGTTASSSNQASSSPASSNPGGEAAENYLIAPRDPRDETHLQELQRCRQALEAVPASQVSQSRNFLKARLPPSVAHQIEQQFAQHLVVEKDAPLPDPRMMPNLKF